MADTDNRILLDWDALEVGETFDKYEYVLTQEMIDTYWKGVMDDEAGFPTIAHKVDVKQYNARYTDNGSVNARCAGTDQDRRPGVNGPDDEGLAAAILSESPVAPA